MKTQTRRLAWLVAYFSVASSGMAAEQEPAENGLSAEATWEVRSADGAVLSAPIVVHGGDNQMFFRTGDAAQQAMQETRDKLADPAGRAALRAEHRRMLEEQHPDMEYELGIDAVTKSKVLELLVDEHLTRLESVYAMQRDHETALQKEADAETQKLASLRGLLGQDGLERFQFYLSTTWERQQVKGFDGFLLATEKLLPEQKKKLVQLFAEKNTRAREQDRESHMSALPLGTLERLASPEELQRQSQLLTIEANEAALRRAQEENPLLEQRAAEFLSSAQLAALERMNEEEVTRLREWIEQARLQAGLSPQVAERPEQSLVPRAAPRKPVAGEATFEFTVTVNRSAPIVHTHTGLNATPILFEAAEGLWVEATPTLYEDDWLDVHLTFYEQVGSEKRRIEKTSSFGSLTRLPDGTFSRGGMSTDMVTGSKGYAVKTLVQVMGQVTN